MVLHLRLNLMLSLRRRHRSRGSSMNPSERAPKDANAPAASPRVVALWLKRNHD